MKVIVEVYLNVRVGAPSLNAPNYQYLAPGSEIDVDGVLYDGDSYMGNNKWLRDAVGNYYWTGGVTKLVEQRSIDPSYWFDQLSISEIRNRYKIDGGKTRVLVLDSGIKVHEGIQLNIVEKVNFTESGSLNDVKDSTGHGTHCACLIGSSSQVKSIGIAPDSELLIGKITEDGSFRSDKLLRKALVHFLDKDIDIISISIALTKSVTEVAELNDLIRKHIDKGRIIVAAIGNDAGLRNRSFKRYPGYLRNCISVGACEWDQTLAKYTLSPDEAFIYCYGSNIGSFKLHNSPQPETGTSQATAIVAGICTLIISFLKKHHFKYTPSSIKDLISIYSTPMTDRETSRIIDVEKIFSQLSKFNTNDSHDKDLSACIKADQGHIGSDSNPLL